MVTSGRRAPQRRQRVSVLRRPQKQATVQAMVVLSVADMGEPYGGRLCSVFAHDAGGATSSSATTDGPRRRERRRAAVEAAYAAAGVGRFAAWVHESDAAMRDALQQRGSTLDETTRAMGMALEDLRVPPTEIDAGPALWSEHLRRIGVSPELLARADHTAFGVLVARLAGQSRATALTFDHDGDCGLSSTSGRSSVPGAAVWAPP